MKYLVSGQVLDTHCNAAFIKQVLPRLFRPVAPGSVGTVEEKQTLFACWEILCAFLLSADFFRINFCKKKYVFGIPSECQTV